MAKPDTLYKWDGRQRTFDGWNQDQTFRQAFQRSAVWVYQEITNGLGPDTMSRWLTQFDYGNADIGPPDNVTLYWLNGPLEISANEQITFLTKLATQQLPLSDKTYANAKPIFKTDEQGTHTLYAKTGWRFSETDTDIGWYVGWVDVAEGDETYVFALNMDMPNRGDQTKRKPILMDALKQVGAWPE